MRGIDDDTILDLVNSALKERVYGTVYKWFQGVQFLIRRSLGPVDLFNMFTRSRLDDWLERWKFGF